MTITRETPGVYIEEITSPGVIQGVSTSIAAFVGPSATGRSDSAVAVTTFDQFVERFASIEQPHLYDEATGTPYFLSFALQGFFQNGGQRAHIARVTNGAAASAELTNTQGGVEAVVRARSEGTWGDAITVAVQPSSRTWRLASPTGSVVGQGSATPPAGFPPGSPRVLELLSATAGFVAGDEVQIVQPPAAPVVDNPGDQSSSVGDVVDLLVTATSGTGGALTFAANGLPAGLAMDNTGRITGTPTTAGQSTVSVQVTDGPQSSTVDFDWVVEEPAPLVTSPGTQQTAVGAAVNLQIQAQSQANPPGALTFADNGLPAGLTMDPSGLITGQPTAAGAAEVTITVTEGGASSTARFTWVIDPPTAPVVDNPGDQRSDVAAPVTLTIVANPPGNLTFTETGLPAGLQLDAAFGQITGTPTAAAITTVTLTATDANGNAGQVTFDWETVDPVPVVVSPGRQATNVGDSASVQIVAQAPTGTTASYAATNLPAGLSIDAATGLISGTVAAVGTNDVTVTVTAGGVANVRFAWVVPAPVFATVERAQGRWLLVAPPDGSTADPAWPGVLAQVILSLLDYPPDRAGIRLEVPAAPDNLPAVGTWVEAGAGSDSVAFRIDRVSSTGVVTVGRREPADREISLRLHRDLTSLSFDLVVNSPTGMSRTTADVSLDPISDRYLLAEGVVPPGVVVVVEPRQPLFQLPRRVGAQVLALAGGADLDLDSLGSQDYQRALDLLLRVDEVSMVCIPDAARYDGSDRVTRRAIQNAQLTHCLRSADRIAIFDPPRTPDDDQRPEDEIANVVNDLRSERGFGAVYYPWVQLIDPRTARGRPRTVLVPPSGHVAGAIARTDNTRGVFKAPANVTLNDVLGVERRLTDAEQGPLNIQGVNVLRILPGSNRVTVWGARTTVDPFVTDWLYLNVRRLLLMIEESIQDSIRWAVFEPNDLGLWKALRRVIIAFLREQWQAGALFGAEEQQAFRVRIDEGLNPPSTRDKGYLFIEIKVAPVRPAEFIVVRIGLFDGGTDIEEG